MEETEFRGNARFEVRRRIGAGGMGVVYEVWDREQNAPRALKTLKTWSADALLRFKDEFRALQDLRHPNLVSLGELFEEAGQWFFTMELIDGVTFLNWVRPVARADMPPPEDDEPTTQPRPQDSSGSGEGPTTPESPLAGARQVPVVTVGDGRRPDFERLRAALIQIARGLLALHGANKVHRDIKPSNMLVTPEGRVVVLDFGVVSDAAGHGLWPDDHLVGTVSYMAPEQSHARPVGPEADWYSVGVVMYQALTGRLPFQGTPEQVLKQKQSSEPKPPRRVASNVPTDLDRLCADLLRLDPAQRPTAREVLRRLRGDEVRATPAPPPPGAHFVGRQEELSVLRDAFAEARVGRAVTLIVSGESGVGKSALLRRFTEAALAEVDGAVVFNGRCHERESVPYKAVDGIVDALSRYLTSLEEGEAELLLPSEIGLMGTVFPTMRRVPAVAQAKRPLLDLFDPQGLRARLFSAVRELLSAIAMRSPVVLVIDDLQWADADSMSLLAELMRPPRAPAVLLVATVRRGSSDASAHSATQIRAMMPGEVRELPLGSLPPGVALELVGLLMRDVGGRAGLSAEEVAREASGHPLFIDELVRAKLVLGAEAGGLRLEEALWARIARLDEPSRGLLELLSVAGTPMAQDSVASAAGTTLGAFTELTARLRAVNLVKTNGVRRSDAIEPYHDRVREAVLLHLDPARKRDYHRRLAVALEAETQADQVALAVHWQGAGEPDKAGAYASRAAVEAALALAFDRAARLYRMAIELRPDAGAEAVALRTGLGDALANAGRGREAAHAYLAAVPTAGAAGALDLQRRAAEELLRSGHIDEGLEVLKTVLAAVGTSLPATPRRALASLLVARARMRLRGLGFRERAATDVPSAELIRIDAYWSAAEGFAICDTIRGADFQTRGLLLALEAGEPVRIARALAAEAGYSASAGGSAHARTVKLLGEAGQLASRIGGANERGLLAAATGLSAYLEGRWRHALEELDRAAGMLAFQCTGMAWELTTAQLYALLSLTYLGEMEELARRLPEQLREAGERGNLLAATTLRTTLCNLAWLAADDVARARAELGEAKRAWTRRGFHLQHYWNLLTESQIDLYADAAEVAHRRVGEQWGALSSSLLLRIQVVGVEALFLRGRCAIAVAEARSPDRDRLLAEADADAARIAGEKESWADPLAALLRAGIAARRGDPRSTGAQLAAAIAGFEKADMALFAAAARLRHGRLVGGDGGKAESARAEAWFAGQKVLDPQRMARMLAPGFGD